MPAKDFFPPARRHASQPIPGALVLAPAAVASCMYIISSQLEQKPLEGKTVTDNWQKAGEINL